jgi:CrcB protein
MGEIIAVGLGGMIGSILRYLIGLIPVGKLNFPIKTFVINIVGAFVIGLVAAYSLKHANVDPKLVLFLKVGICGGFTTFSSYALETTDLMKSGHMALGLCYVILSIILGILAVMLGEWLINH